MCDAQDFSDKGLHSGQVVSWNVYSKLAGTGGTLTETVAVGESNFTIAQGTGTVREWGIAVPFTSLTDYFGKHSVTAIVKDVLARDCRETLDTAAHTEFNRAMLRYVGTATAAAGVLTTNGTATATNGSALNKYHVRAISDTMKERNIPAYAGDDYVGVARPATLRPLKNELEDVNKYVETGYGKILKGELGRFEGVRFVEQTHINKGVNNTGTAWSSSASDWAYFMGGDTVAEIISIPPEIRGKIPSDFGRSMGMMWYAIEGFGIVYNSSNDASGTNSRIVKWDSAA